MSTDFLPKDYTVPSSSDGYMKLQQGENTIRIMASPILGWEWWVDTADGKRKPQRCRMTDAVPLDHAENVKHFWAMPVYNYTTKKIQILSLTQKGIQKALRSLASNAKWGSPTKYDIMINRSGEGLETEYSVIPEPPSAMDPTLVEMFEKMNLQLEALYDGGDPFTGEGATPAVDEDLVAFADAL